MDFRADKTKTTYIGREAQLSWLDWAGKTIQPENKIIADIACGGGIYARGFVHLMAKHVFGIDFSEHSLVEAKGFSGHITNLDFMVGEASKTGLASNCVDIVFERALIHHLSEKQKTDNLQEIQRILKMDGLTVIQDRTFEDVTSDHPDYWIRAVLFATFPRLLEYEKKRRPNQNAYFRALEVEGFRNIRLMKYPEHRKTYLKFEDLEQEILSCKGKSILFELNDRELRQYCHNLRKTSVGKNLVEVDLWTIWLANGPTENRWSKP